MCSKPWIFLKGFEIKFDLLRLLLMAGNNVWLIKVDFPDPETPVIQTRFPKGIFKSTFFKLFPVQPEISINSFELIEWLFSISIFLFPEIYSPVNDLSSLTNLLKGPEKQTAPPWTPAPGPISIMWSAASIVSWSCSTTTTVFPRSLNFFKVDNNFELSLWWSPIDGSSNM